MFCRIKDEESFKIKKLTQLTLNLNLAINYKANQTTFNELNSIDTFKPIKYEISNIRRSILAIKIWRKTSSGKPKLLDTFKKRKK